MILERTCISSHSKTNNNNNKKNCIDITGLQWKKKTKKNQEASENRDCWQYFPYVVHQVRAHVDCSKKRWRRNIFNCIDTQSRKCVRAALSSPRQCVSQPVKPVVITLVVRVESVTVFVWQHNGLIIAGSILFHQDHQQVAVDQHSWLYYRGRDECADWMTVGGEAKWSATRVKNIQTQYSTFVLT